MNAAVLLALLGTALLVQASVGPLLKNHLHGDESATTASSPCRDDVVKAALAVAGGARDGESTLDAVTRGLAHEVVDPETMKAVVARYRDGVAAQLSLLGDGDVARSSSSSSWIDSLLGPVSPAPEQIHLSLANGAELAIANVSVMWLTSNATMDGQVCWTCGGAAAAETCVSAESYTYHPISELPWYGRIHRAFMGPAGPSGAPCRYRVGPLSAPASGNASLWSANQTFFAPSLKNSVLPERPLFVALGGDMGTIQLFGYKVAKQMFEYATETNAPAFDAFWHLGDIAYSTLDPPKLNFEFFWDMYLRQEQPLISSVPMLSTYGNHDFSGGDSAAFINRFWNPRALGGNANFYFAYKHGPVMYVSMCTEVALNPSECDYRPGSAQYVWLEQTFASVNRTETPWLVLAGHRPMYSSDKDTDSGPLQQYIEPLLLRYKVDVELAGHMHCTEVTTPVANNTANMSGVTTESNSSFTYVSPGAPVHITAGTLGAVIAEKWLEPAPAWSMIRSGTLFSESYGFVTLQATRSSLEFVFHRESDRTLLWALTIIK